MDTFNPYSEWLALGASVTQPDYYQLVGLNRFENDQGKIVTAADRAKAKVRACRPGSQAARWALILDELDAAKKCLTDPVSKQQYDQRLKSGNVPARGPSTAPAPAASSSTPAAPDAMYPPGMAGNVAKPVAANPANFQPATPSPIPATTQAPEAQYASLDYDLPPGAASTPNVNPMDPMAPVPQAGAPHAAVNPMTPAAYDPMAPAYGSPATPGMYQAGPASPMSPVGQQSPAGYGAAGSPMGPAGGAEEGQPLLAAKAKSATARVSASKRQSRQKIVVIGVGLGVTLLCGAIALHFLKPKEDPQVAQETDGGPRDAPPKDAPAKDASPKDGAPTDGPAKDGGMFTPSDVNPISPRDPGPRPTDGMPPTDPPMPNPVDDPMMVNPPMTDPPLDDNPFVVVDPPPAVMPAPMPMSPPPPRADIEALATALTAARRALYEKNLNAADAELAKAEPLMKLPEHDAKFQRLKKVAMHVRGFWQTVVDGVQTQDAGDEFRFSETTIAIVVEVQPDLFIIRAGGQNQRYVPSQMPAGLAMKVVERVTDANDPTVCLFKGAIYAIEATVNPDKAADARQYWNLAGSQGTDVDDLFDFLSDDYDLLNATP